MIRTVLCLAGCLLFAGLAACVGDSPDSSATPEPEVAQDKDVSEDRGEVANSAQTDADPKQTEAVPLDSLDILNYMLGRKLKSPDFRVHPNADDTTHALARYLIPVVNSAWKDGMYVSEAVRWAPTMCMAQPLDVRGHKAVPSQAESGEHARKLYVLQASHSEAYKPLADQQPPGQTILKHTWYPQEEHKLVRGKDGPLFVMHKVGPDAPDGIETDAGWIYAVFDTEGRLQAAGKIKNCMTCHQDTEKDRMFGLPPTE